MADTTKKFVVYKSSAGSGKTFRLALEYIKLLLINPKNYRKILASTFTNKAANEMKSKILNYLTELSSVGLENAISNDFYKAIKKETGFSDAIIRENALSALTWILHDFSDFSVMTIDKFTTKLARSFQFDLMIENDFEIDLNVDETVKTAIDNLYSLAGQNSRITEILTSYIVECVENNRSWKSEELINGFSTQIQKEASISHLKLLENLSFEDFKEFINWSLGFIRNYKKALRETGKEGLEIFERFAIDPAPLLYKSGGLYGQFVKLIAEVDEENKHARKSFETNIWFNAQAVVADQKNIEPLLPRFTDLLNQFYRQRENQTIPGIPDTELFHSLILINRNIYAMALLHEIKQVINDYKELNNLVFLSELNQKISDHISTEPAPFIYERIGNQYHHILLDEFQDNSLLQWRNFIPLFENALAFNNLCLIVGDGKQSIYRWRNGVVEQFAALPGIYSPPDESEIWQTRQNQLKNHFQQFELEENFRSDQAIVEFNNHFFRYLNTRFNSITATIYDNLEQKTVKTNPGYVSVEFLEKPDTEDPTNPILNRILEIIDNQNTGLYQLKDIAILCRTNSTARKISEFLMENKIPVVSSESIILGSSHKVQIIVSFFRLISSSDYRFYSIEIAGLLLKTGLLSANQFDNFIFTITTLDSKTQAEYKTHFIELLKTIDKNINFKKLIPAPLYEKTEYLSAIFGFNKIPDPFLVFFLQSIKEFSLKNGNNIEDFLLWWDTKGNVKSIIIPPEHDAVKIMTIHKAKGLQFPIVIYPFANDKTELGRNSFWAKANINTTKIDSFLVKAVSEMKNSLFKDQYKQEKESALLDIINLMYVALTRASKKMFILATEINKPEISETVAGFLMSFLIETRKSKDIHGRYTYGLDDTELFIVNNSDKKDRISENQKDSIWFSEDWHDRTLISFQNAGRFPQGGIVRKIEKGKLIHDFFSKIHYKQDIAKSLYQMELEGLIDEIEKTQFSILVNKVVHHPQLSEYFTDKYLIRTESEILLPDGKIYRPDRVMTDNNEVHILDYKTGEKAEHHLLQIKSYAEVLRNMGYQVKNLYLIYLTDSELDIVQL